MSDSHSAFIGEMPRNYDKYLGPLIFSEYAEDLAKRVSVPSGGVLLETAAGTGMARSSAYSLKIRGPRYLS